MEVALKLKDRYNFEVEVLIFTRYDYTQPIKKSLAMRADRAFVLLKPSFTDTQVNARI